MIASRHRGTLKLDTDFLSSTTDIFERDGPFGRTLRYFSKTSIFGRLTKEGLPQKRSLSGVLLSQTRRIFRREQSDQSALENSLPGPTTRQSDLEERLATRQMASLSERTEPVRNSAPDLFEVGQ